ncbi:MAG: hypothetical protein ABSG87_08680 [Verrucomicrobiota bacterium]
MDVFANSGTSSDNPYTQIVTRNMFALDTSVLSTSSTPTEPLPTITPNGIMSVFGSVQTLFKVSDNQPGQPASEKSYILGEGQRKDGIEVIRIDEKNAVVTFNNHGTVQELPLVAATPSNGFPTAPGNVWQTASSNLGALYGNRFAGGTALASGNRMSGNNGSITDSSGSGSGYAAGAYKNNPSGQGLMVPNASFAGTSDSDNASLQAPAVSNDVGSDNNSVSGQGADISAAEHLADIQMVLFAREHMQ